MIYQSTAHFHPIHRYTGRGPWCSGFKSCLPGKSGIQVSKKQIFLPCSLVQIQYCGEPPRPTCSELGLRPPGYEFQVLCLEGSVILPIAPSSVPWWHRKALTQWPPFLNVIVPIRSQVYACWKWPSFHRHLKYSSQFLGIWVFCQAARVSFLHS